jgi:hypothetical protein
MAGGKDLERSGRRIIEFLSWHFPGRLRKITKTLGWDTGVPADIRIQHLLNKNQKRHL